MEDTFKHKGMRKKMVEELRQFNVFSDRVLDALEKVPRHLYIDTAFLEFAAYDLKAFGIGADQTISSPYTVAFQTELLEINKGDKILEIGTGSGYQTSVLLEMGAKVYTIERQKALFERTKAFLPKLGYSAKLHFGDGYKGLPLYAPFDKVIVTAAAPYIPPSLFEQMVVGGKMVIPLEENNLQIMTLIVKTGPKTHEKTTFGEFRFVPLLEEKSWKKG